jgi:hypothetical protein
MGIAVLSRQNGTEMVPANGDAQTQAKAGNSCLLADEECLPHNSNNLKNLVALASGEYVAERFR